MKLIGVAAIPFALLMSVALAAQSGSQNPPPAEQVFKNIQVLKGIPVDDFMDTMGIMSAALGFDCVECHVGAGTDTVKWEADTDKKRSARRMTLMVAAINRTNFGGRQVVTCWTCHRGRDIPVTMPGIDAVYGEPCSGARSHRHGVGSGRADCRRDSRQISASAWWRGTAGQSHQLHCDGHERGVPRLRRWRPGAGLCESARSACDHHQVCREYRPAGCHTRIRRPQRMGIGTAGGRTENTCWVGAN